MSTKQMTDSPNLARVAARDWTILEYLERINSRAHEIAVPFWTKSGASKLAALIVLGISRQSTET